MELRTAAFLLAVAHKIDEEKGKLRHNGFVFDGSGGQWEKLAFTFYTDIAELSMEAHNVLAEDNPDKLELLATVPRYLSPAQMEKVWQKYKEAMDGPVSSCSCEFCRARRFIEALTEEENENTRDD